MHWWQGRSAPKQRIRPTYTVRPDLDLLAFDQNPSWLTIEIFGYF